MLIPFLSICLFIFSLPAQAQGLDAETRVVLKAIGEKYKALGNWQAKFTQETASTGLGTSTFSEGSLYFVAPNRFRYTLEKPEFSEFISNGKSAWHVRYVEGKDKPARVRSIPDLSKTELDRYLVFLRGIRSTTKAEEKKLVETYDVKGASRPEEIQLELKPKNSAEVSKITLIFKQKADAPYRIIVEDVIGTRTSVTINSFEKIKKVDAKQFEAKYPKGSQMETLQ